MAQWGTCQIKNLSKLFWNFRIQIHPGWAEPKEMAI